MFFKEPLEGQLFPALAVQPYRWSFALMMLAVEAAMGYEQLAALAPRIRDAAGDKAYTSLHRVLFEADET